MLVEMPTFNKCCYCVPLRYGLLIWGYMKLVVALINLILIALVSLLTTYFADYLIHLFVIDVAIVICLIDIAFTIVFVVGAHKKDYKLLRVFYYYSITFLVIYIAVVSVGMIFQIKSEAPNLSPGHELAAINRFVLQIIFFISTIGLQGHMLLVTRSEVIKLKTQLKVEFVNSGAESHGMMTDANGAPAV